MRDDRGIALLEVLIALAILSTAGTAIVALVAEATRSLVVARSREVEVERAGQALAALTLHGPGDLDLRLGQRVEGGWVSRVERPRPGLYRLSIAAAAAPDAELVVTVVQAGVAP